MINRNYPFSRSLTMVLRKHNGTLSPTDRTRQAGKLVAGGTANRRSQVLWQMFRQLHDAGYEIRNVENFRQKHVDAVLEIWMGTEPPLSAGTLQTRLSVVRAFCAWIGKAGLVPPTRKLFDDPAMAERLRREAVAKEDRSWSAQGVVIEDVLARVSELDKWVGIQMKLQAQFGLRVKEAALLRPRESDNGVALLIELGTKNRRPRVVKITMPEQRAVLDQAKSMVQRASGSMTPQRYSWPTWQDHYYYVLRMAGVTKQGLGVTSHGLRHERINNEYENLTGHPSPVRGGQIADVEVDRAARAQLSQLAGHNRRQVVSCYAGSARVPSKAATAGHQDMALEVETPTADGESDEDTDATGGA